MRKVKLYIAMSLNGKIARQDGRVDWLDSIPNPEKNDYGYGKFIESIDTTLMGNKTYQQIIDWGIDFPYPDKKNYVFTTNKVRKNTEFVEFITEKHVEFVKQLKKGDGRDIWLIGGGKLNTWFLNETLIDEIRIFIMPIVIPEGIEVFEKIPIERKLKLQDVITFKSGVVELNYSMG